MSVSEDLTDGEFRMAAGRVRLENCPLLVFSAFITYVSQTHVLCGSLRRISLSIWNSVCISGAS